MHSGSTRIQLDVSQRPVQLLESVSDVSKVTRLVMEDPDPLRIVGVPILKCVYQARVVPLSEGSCAYGLPFHLDASIQ